MDKLFRAQENLKERIVKSKINFGKQAKDRITLNYVETRLETLDQSWNVFNNTHERIMNESEDKELEASSYYKEDLFMQVEELYVEHKSKLKECLSKLRLPAASVTVPTTDSSSCNKSSKVQLPKISIPTFTGKYTEWASFKDLFTSLVHKNNEIDNVQKLYFLKAHVQGEAEQLLRHIPVTSDNYVTCWSQLQNRYDNKKYLANCILKRFMSMKNVTTESSSAIRQLLDITNESLHALENLGVDVSTWDIIVVHIVTQKLDSKSRELWETKNNDSSNDLPILCDFQKFLENRFRALECIESQSGTKQSNSRNSNTLSLHVASNETGCILCSENHKLCNCKTFGQKDVTERHKFVRTSNLCFNCLNPNHTVYSCRQSARCRLCKRKHHTLLHPQNAPKAVGEGKTEQLVEKDGVLATSSTSTKAMTCLATSSSQVLLATALVNVQSKTGATICLRSLIDQGSQASFITESSVQLLKLKKNPVKSLVSGLGADPQASLACKSMVSFKIQSRLDPSFLIPIKAYVLSKLTTLLPERQVFVRDLPVMASVELADPSFSTPNKIDLLLGAEVYSKILMQGLITGPPGSPIAQKTALGWILSGEVETVGDPACYNAVVSLHSVHVEANDLLKSFWELESEHYSVEKKHLTDGEQACERLYSETTQRDDSGRYVVRLPFHTPDPQCKYGNSQQIAKKRFLLLEKRLMKDPDLKEEYVKVINEYMKLGHMEVVKDKDKSDVVYLPHHAVVRKDKLTTKVRVVFDASCPGNNGVSLNQDLLVGPTLQPELRHILMNWRCYPIGIVADVIKMYRQIKIAEADVDFQRLWWRQNPEDELQHLQLTRVTFGTSAAPFLAVKSLQQIALDEGNDFPLASVRVLKEFYVDDYMTGCQTVAEGLQVYQQTKELIGRAGFQLQKWSTSNDELLKQMTEEERSSNDNLELKTDNAVTKILGLTWNRESDEFEYTVQLPPQEIPVTKRKVISDIARLFDPLGWIAPIIVTAKCFIQKIWLSGIEWDQELPPALMNDWLNFRKDLNLLTNFRIPRWIRSSTDDQSIELHGFSDASTVAYAAVVYTRVIKNNGSIHVHLITSKTKVAPIKQVSIPRLELCGMVLLAKLLREVSNVLNIPRQHMHAWTDSSVVLAWLKSHPGRWKTFVANRVADILTILDSNQVAHVPSQQNPADATSRGIKPSESAQLQLWQEGPENKERINKKSKLSSLSPFLGAVDVLRVGGRLQKSNLDQCTKHPFLIPQNSNLARLLVADAHARTCHGGPQLMITFLRSKYWIINAKSLARQYVRKCVVCVRHSAKTTQQMMGQLPEARVTPSRSFRRSGVDYAGPIGIRPSKGRGYHSTKGYICLFVCMATKAIHLEVMSDMTAQSFLAAFKRFVARRGHVAEIWSDNGTTFVRGAKELKLWFNSERSSLAPEIADWFASNGTDFHFIPPYSPNFGGLWEAGVRSVKGHLKRIIGTSTLTFEEMTTLLSQIEACLNSRPLFPISDHPNEPYVLTPGHFLFGEPLVAVPDRNYEDSNISSLHRWHLTQKMLQIFWRRWSREYLTHLQHRYRWKDVVSEPKVGDIVLIKEDDLPPARWLFGVITAKHTGSDGLTRVLSVKSKLNSVIKRPLSKVVVLPTT